MKIASPQILGVCILHYDLLFEGLFYSGISPEKTRSAFTEF